MYHHQHHKKFTTMHTRTIKTDKHTGNNYGQIGYLHDNDNHDGCLTLHKESYFKMLSNEKSSKAFTSDRCLARSKRKRKKHIGFDQKGIITINNKIVRLPKEYR